jgi:monoamine oxidase
LRIVYVLAIRIVLGRLIFHNVKQSLFGLSRSFIEKDSVIHQLDLAIVGAGVSGLYSGWRWMTSPAGQGTRSAVFECSDRIGGRLLTVQPPGMPEAKIELGGMRFTSNHKIIKALIVDMQLEVESFQPSESGNIAYLRGRHLKTADLAHPERVPYEIPQEDYEGFRSGFTALAAKRFLGKVLKTSDVDLQNVDWDAVADKGIYDDHAVTDLTLRYAFSHSMNNESFQFAEDSSGYGSIFRTWNAVDGFAWNLDDYSPDVSYWRLNSGFETVPITLRDRYLAAGGKVHCNHRLIRFDTVRLADGTEGVKLHFAVGQEERVVHARRLILAMPRRSLELLEQRGAVLDLNHKDVRALIRSVVPVPLFKLVLCYRHRWWEDLGITRGQSVTDLPVRQCYYWPVGGNTKAGAILIYNDGHSMDYWEGLRGHPDKFSAPLLVKVLTRMAAVDGEIGPRERDLVQAFADEWDLTIDWNELSSDGSSQRRIIEVQKAITEYLDTSPPQSQAAHLLELAQLLIDADEHISLEEQTAFDEISRSISQFQNKAHLSEAQLPAEEWKQYPAPALMVKEAHRQILAMHNAKDTPDRKPYSAAYRDWRDNPYGGGANFWRQHVNSRKVSRRIVQPMSGRPVYICGEAYSHEQGWVEGALMTAEDLLQNHLGLQPPAFLTTSRPEHHLHGD